MKNYKFVVAMIIMGTIIASGVFAQAKNVVSLDVVPLLKGFIASDNDAKTSSFGISASYERLIAPHYSIGAAMTILSTSFDGTVMETYFGLDAHGRWYPLGESLEKLFFDAGLGFNTITPKEGNGTEGLTFGLKTGYKLNIKSNFFVEPSLAYNLLKTGSMEIAPLGWHIGVNIGLSF
jgi:hypothetical protein